MSTRAAAASRRKEAETAAYGLLAGKVATVSALAELAAEVDATAERVTAAQQAHGDAQQRYAEQYRTARAAGWSIADLAAAGCDQEHAGGALRARPRSRSGASGPDAAATATAPSGSGSTNTTGSATDPGAHAEPDHAAST